MKSHCDVIAPTILIVSLLLSISCQSVPTDPAHFPRFGHLTVRIPTPPDARNPVRLICGISPRAFVVNSMKVEYLKHACESPPATSTEAIPHGIERPAKSQTRGQCGPKLSEGPDRFCLYEYNLNPAEAREPGDCLTFVCRASYQFSSRNDPEILQSKPCTSNSDPNYDSTRCNFGR